MELLIFEGPAGSGKTTLLNTVCEQYPKVQRIPTAGLGVEINRPRDYIGWSGIALSQIKDHFQLTAAVLELHRLMDMGVAEFPTFAMDRYFLSQWVYGALRDERARHMAGHDALLSLTLMARAMLRSIHAASIEFHTRTMCICGLEDMGLGLHLVFCLPTVEALKENRSRTQRDFPYDPEEELRLYDFAANQLARAFGQAMMNRVGHNFLALELKVTPLHSDQADYGYDFGEIIRDAEAAILDAEEIDGEENLED